MPRLKSELPVPVSVIVPAKNEAQNLSACLASLAWADEVYVVDSYSTDDTRAIAEQMGATVVDFDYDGGWPKKKNWALQTLPLRNDWVLIIDADERVTPELEAEIVTAIQRPDATGFYVRWKFMFLGRWMRHCWNDGWMLRLFRRDRAVYEDLGMRGEGGWDNEVHENMLLDGKPSFLRSYLLHESEQNLAFWIKKHNDYSTWDAKRRQLIRAECMPPLGGCFTRDPMHRRRWCKALLLRLPCKPMLVFFYLYFFRLGFLDGKPGWYFCSARAAHELFTNAKEYELLEQRGGDKGAASRKE
jgi:glycosyltransferase involved in cell wall biosynthesis